MKAKKALAFVLCAALLFSTFAATYVPQINAVISTSDVLLDLDFSTFNGEASITDKTGNLTVDTSAVTKGAGKAEGESSISFDGSTTIQWNDTVYDPFALSDTGVTVSIWMCVPNGRNDWTQFFAYNNGAAGSGVIFQSTGGQALRPNLGKDGNWGNIDDNGYTGNNTWMMVTFAQDYANGNTYAYVNGELKASGNKTFTVKELATMGDTAGQYSIGGPVSNVDQWMWDSKYPGLIRNFTVYGRALSAGEIAKLYDPTAGADMDKVNNTISLIEAIGTVDGSATCLAAIRAAQSSYNALNDIEKEAVTNAAILNTAFNDYSLAYASANNGKLLEMTFEDSSLSDSGDRVTAVKNDSVTFTSGKEENTTAAQFVGSSNKQGIKWNSAAYDPLALATDSLTLSMWVYIDSTPATHSTVFMIKTATGGDDGFFIIKAHPDVWSVCMRAVGGNEVAFSSSSAPTVGEWTLVTYTQKGSTGKLYLNDQLAATKTGMPEISRVMKSGTGFKYSADYALGCGNWWNDPSLPGKMDSVTMYNKELSILDIADIYGGIVKDDAAIDAAKAKITAIGTVSATADSLALIRSAQAAYDALTDIEKAYVDNAAALTAAWDSYYSLSEAANNGQLVYFDFEDGAAKDVADRVTANVGSSVNSVGGFTSDNTALSLANGKTRDDNMKISWSAGSYDPFGKIDNGVTISTWVKTEEMNDWSTLFSYGDSNNFIVMVPQCGWDERNHAIRVALKYNNGSENEVVGSESINASHLGEWTMITFTQSADNVAKLYVNGEKVAENTLSVNLKDIAVAAGSGVSYNIGYTPFFGDNNFQGAYEDFAIYNSALSAEQISALASADYSLVEAAKAAVPSDLSGYTSSSAAAVTAAVNAVDYTKLASQQTEVNAYAAAINSAVANLIIESVEMNVSISEGMVTAADESGKYNITWNATISAGDGTTITNINDSGIVFKSYGVFYATTTETLEDYKNADASTIRQKIFNSGEDIDVYTIFGFRLKNVNESSVRAAMFYIEYTLDGKDYIVLSTIDEVVAVIS